MSNKLCYSLYLVSKLQQRYRYTMGEGCVVLFNARVCARVRVRACVRVCVRARAQFLLTLWHTVRVVPIREPVRRG